MYTLSLSILGHIVLAIPCPQGLWTTLRTNGPTEGRPDGQTDNAIPYVCQMTGLKNSPKFIMLLFCSIYYVLKRNIDND